MAVNLASSYAKKVDERFYLTSLTEQSVHQDFSWEGVNAINVYSIATAAMANYTRSGSARYGTAAELDDTVANYLLTRDRSFTFTIDRGNHIDSQMVRESGKALARQLNEVVTPEIDIYRLTKYAATATANAGDSAVTVITASNAYASLLDGGVYLDNNKVPRTGRVAYVRPSFYKFIKLDPSFMKSSEIAQQKLINGQVGEVDGVAIVMVPDSYLPANREFILVHKSAMVAPKKLQDYKTHDNPPGKQVA